MYSSFLNSRKVQFGFVIVLSQSWEMLDAVTDGGVDSSSAVIFDHCPSVPQYFLHLNYCISQSYEVYHYSTLSSMELNTPV